jgi:hypothetical protein
VRDITVVPDADAGRVDDGVLEDLALLEEADLGGAGEE